MISVYIETSALFRAYTRESGSDVMDEVFSQMESHQITGVISPLSIPEILRGIIKRKNLRELSEEEAQKVIDSILLDVNTRIANEEILISAFDEECLPEVDQLIRYSNFYVIDALQIITACHCKPDIFLHADNHFAVPAVENRIHALDIRKCDALQTIQKFPRKN